MILSVANVNSPRSKEAAPQLDRETNARIMSGAPYLTLEAEIQRGREITRHSISDVLKALTQLAEPHNILRTPLGLIFRVDKEKVGEYLKKLADENGQLLASLADYISVKAERRGVPQTDEEKLRTAGMNHELMLSFVTMLDEPRTTLAKLMRFLTYMMGNTPRSGDENTSVENVAIMNQVLTDNLTNLP